MSEASVILTNSSLLARHYIRYKNDCATNSHNCDIPSMGCGGEYRADMLS